MSTDHSRTFRNAKLIDTKTEESSEDDNAMAKTADENSEAASESDVSSQTSQKKNL